MTMVDTLLDEVKNAPDAIVAETLDFVRFLKQQHTQKIDGDDLTEQDKRNYMQQSLQYAAQLYGDEDDLCLWKRVEINPMWQPGDVVTVPFQGAIETKHRPAVILSSATYQANRPDIIVGLLTTQTYAATTPIDYILQDWSAAGLNRPSAFRAYMLTAPRTEVIAHIGRLSERDWQQVAARITLALGTSTP